MLRLCIIGLDYADIKLYLHKMLDYILRKRFCSKYFDEYHFNVVASANKIHSFKGRTVLDIGGSNVPEGLVKAYGAKKFICIDPVTKWGHAVKDGKSFGKKIYKSGELNNIPLDEFAYVIDEDFENLGDLLNNSIDVIISTSTFEHLTSLKDALAMIYRFLKPDGILYSHFEPIFSSPIGHHVFNSKDLDFHKMDDLRFFHLLYNKDEALNFLKEKTKYTKEQIEQIVYQAYDSKLINRFMFKDYIEALSNSQFNDIKLKYWYTIPVPEDILKILINKYGEMRFDVVGMEIVAKK